MEFVTTMFAFFMLFGIVHAKEWEPKIHTRGTNATIRIEQLEIDEKNTLEITFSGFISKQHVTNVMLYAPKKNQSDNISINTNYKGRIEMIKIDKSSLSFLLLNVDFVDSGNYTVSQDSQRKGATSIFVPRHRLLGNNTEPMIVSFTCNITYSSSIKIEMMISKNHFYVLKYDVTRSNCTEEGNLYRNRIESCVLKGSNFSFTIRQINLFDMGMYVAWDDKDILMDSVFVEFEGNNTTSNPGKRDPDFSSLLIPNLSGSGKEYYMLEWFLVSAVVVVFVAAGLIINAAGRLLQGKSKARTYNPTHMNARQNITNISSNFNQSREIAYISEGPRMILAENNSSADQTDFEDNHIKNEDIQNENHLCARGIDSTKYLVSKIQIHPILSSSCERHQSEPTQEYDVVDEHNEPEIEFPHDQSHGSYNHDYVAQYYNKSLRTQDFIITKKAKEEVSIANSFPNYTKVKKTSPVRIDPSTFYAKAYEGRTSGIHCASDRAEFGSSESSNILFSPSYVALEDSFSGDVMGLTNCMQHRQSKKQRISQSLSSIVHALGPESSELQDLKSETVSQNLYYEFDGTVSDDSSARKRGHRRSQSYGTLYRNLMANESV